MAEAILNIVAEGVLRKGLELASTELSLLWGFENSIQKLAETLEVIQELVLDADSKRISLRSVRRWMKNLSAAAADADNVLDEFGYQILRQEVLGSQKFKLVKVREFFSSSNPLRVRHELSRKINEVNSTLDELYKRANDIGLRPVELLHTSAEPIELRTSDPFVNESTIVGRDDDKNLVVKMLLSSVSKGSQPIESSVSSVPHELEVIGIVGMPGLGKTTLAQVVYKNEEVVSFFDITMWICVSDDFNVNRLLNEMMQCLGSTHSHDLNNREALKNNIREKLNGKRYLLVLDDVWNENHGEWESLKEVLTQVGNPSGNKVLVTARSKAVVSTMQSSRYHSLEALSNDNHSWSLFNEIVFANGDLKKTPELDTIGKRMVEKCKGVPLAIKTLAHLMRTIKDENEWSALEKNDKWSSQRSGDAISSAVRLSYDHLPSLSLKQCFAYCSLFKKDAVLEREKLIQLWAAQGLLSPPEGCHDVPQLEYFIGNNYFNVFTQNTFFDNLKKDEYDNVISCKVHDLVHDFSLEISKGHCFTLPSGQENGLGKAIHLTSDQQLISEFPERISQKLRTLWQVSGIPDFLASLRSLRVLILEEGEYSELPHSIRKLKQLRYLDISKTSIKRLPNSICKLFYLQTLRLNLLTMLPPKFENLVNLRHFYICNEAQDKLNCLLPKVKHFTHLQVLPYFVVSHKTGCKITELGGLKFLKGKLSIYCLEHVANVEEAKGANLSNKSDLDRLELSWNGKSSHDTASNVLEGLEPHPNLKSLKILNFEGSKLSTWMLERSSILQNLAEIELRNCNKCEQVPALGRLPCLKTVGLYGLQKVRQIGKEFYGLTGSVTEDSTRDSFSVFPVLKVIVLEDMPSLEEWVDAKHISGEPIVSFLKLEKFRLNGSTVKHLPVALGTCGSLSTMEILSCHNLLTVPDMHNLQSLVKLTLKECKSLNALPNGIQGLPSLKELDVGGFCEELDSFPWPSLEKAQQLYFPSLASLQLLGWEKLNQLPEQLEELPSLSSLQIKKFSRLEGLPEWLPNVRTLEKLKLIECEKLKELQLLPKLKVLQSLSCPFLVDGCVPHTGSQWKKIKHVDHKEIQGKNSQGIVKGYGHSRKQPGQTDADGHFEVGITFRMGELNSKLGEKEAENPSE